MSNKKTGNKKVDLSTITTLKLLEETKLRIEKLREHKRESYDDILRKILYILNVVREDPERSKKILERIDELRRRMFEEEKKQKEDLQKELGISVKKEMPVKVVMQNPEVKPQNKVMVKRVVRRVVRNRSPVKPKVEVIDMNGQKKVLVKRVTKVRIKK